MTLDTNAKTFALTGSDTGTTQELLGTGHATWGSNVSSGTGGSQIKYNNDVAFTTSVGTSGGFGNFDTRIFAASVGTSFTFALAVSQPEQALEYFNRMLKCLQPTWQALNQ